MKIYFHLFESVHTTIIFLTFRLDLEIYKAYPIYYLNSLPAYF